MMKELTAKMTWMNGLVANAMVFLVALTTASHISILLTILCQASAMVAMNLFYVASTYEEILQNDEARRFDRYSNMTSVLTVTLFIFAVWYLDLRY